MSVNVWIENEGPGIAPEHRDQNFQPFFRGGAPAADITGTGLGLAVSRQIIEAPGGEIGFGATLRRPVSGSSSPTATPERQQEPPGCKNTRAAAMIGTVRFSV